MYVLIVIALRNLQNPRSRDRRNFLRAAAPLAWLALHGKQLFQRRNQTFRCNGRNEIRVKIVFTAEKRRSPQSPATMAFACPSKNQRNRLSFRKSLRIQRRCTPSAFRGLSCGKYGNAFIRGSVYALQSSVTAVVRIELGTASHRKRISLSVSISSRGLIHLKRWISRICFYTSRPGQIISDRFAESR